MIGVLGVRIGALRFRIEVLRFRNKVLGGFRGFDVYLLSIVLIFVPILENAYN